MLTLGVNINGMSSEDAKLKPYAYFLFNVDPNSLPKNLLKILRQRILWKLNVDNCRK